MAHPRSPDARYANPMDAGQRRTPDQIENDIEATRTRIEARLEGLSREASPSRLLETTLGADLSSPTDTINSLYVRARSNPISAALIGAGLVALYLGKRTEDPVAIARARREDALDDGREVPGPATRDAAERVAYDIAALKGHARSVGDDVSSARTRLTSSATATRDDTVSGARRTTAAVSGAVDDAGDYVSDTASSLSAKARSTYDNATDTLSSAYEGASERLSHAPAYARERAQYAGSWVQENPVAAGLIGLALGATAASVFATTRSTAPRSRAEATRNLYRQADGYSTAEELQRQALREEQAAMVTGTTGAARRPAPATGQGTMTSAVNTAANPARSTASQAARRAPSTAKETVGKKTTTRKKSTVAKTTTKPKKPTTT